MPHWLWAFFYLNQLCLATVLLLLVYCIIFPLWHWGDLCCFPFHYHPCAMGNNARTQLPCTCWWWTGIREQPVLGTHVQPRAWCHRKLILGTVTPRREVQSCSQVKESQSRNQKESFPDTQCGSLATERIFRSEDRFPERRLVSKREWRSQKGSRRVSRIRVCRRGAGTTFC